MSRSHRRPRIRGSVATVVAIVAAVVLTWTGTVGSVPGAVAAQAAPGVRVGPTLTARPDVERRERVRTRGRVDVERAAEGGGKERQVQGADPAPLTESPIGTSAAAAPGDATTSGTAAPTLVKLPLVAEGANTPLPMVAVGPDHVIRSDDGLLRISSRTGSGTTNVPYAELFLLTDEMEAQQGRVIFDPARQRWIAVQASRDCVPEGEAAEFGHGYLDFAISDTADPTGAWSVYFYTYNDALVTNPAIGLSSNKLVLTSSFSEMGPGCASAGPAIWDITAMRISLAISGGDDDAAYVVLTGDADQEILHLTPAIGQPTSGADVQIVAQTNEIPETEQHTWLMTVEGTGSSAGTSIATQDLTALGVMDTLGAPPPIDQGAGSFDASPWPTSAVTRGSRLVFAQAETCQPPGGGEDQSCLRIVDLNVANDPPTSRQDVYLAASGTDTYGGGLAFSLSGELVVTYARSSDAAGPSSYVIRQAPGDTLGSFSPPRTLQAASALYAEPNGAEWVGAAPDPLVPDAVWVINQSGKTVSPSAYDLRAAQARTATGATFVPIEPLRVLDTRVGTGLSGSFVSGTPRSFEVAGVGVIPDDAIAVTGNVTVTGQTSAGYVSITPSPTLVPTSSTINFPSGDTRANNLTVSLNTSGDLAAVFKGSSGRRAHILLDITGYFLADDSSAAYEPLTPARILDTRVGNGLSGRFIANTPRTLQVTGRGGVPADAVAISGNLTVVGQTGSGYVSVTPLPDATPSTSTINFPSGDTRANGLTIPLSPTGTVSAVYKRSSGSTHLLLDVTGYYVEDTTGLRFYALEPGRLMDTRSSSLTQLTGRFVSSQPRTLATGGHVGVPADALAITGNLTVVGQSSAGYVSVTKTPTANPTVSTINFPASDVRANGITVPLNGDNDMALVFKSSSGTTTHLVLDVTGYFQ